MTDELGQTSIASKLSNKARFILPIAIGILLMIAGIRIFQAQKPQDPKVLITANQSSTAAGKYTVHIAGAVEQPGVYQLESGSRVNDLISRAGGFSRNADRNWIDTTLNLAQKITDGMKLYIPARKQAAAVSQQAVGEPGISEKININAASKDSLDSLSGVGEATAEKIIGNRPYQSVDELLSKKVLSKSVFERVKEKVSVY